MPTPILKKLISVVVVVLLAYLGSKVGLNLIGSDDKPINKQIEPVSNGSPPNSPALESVIEAAVSTDFERSVIVKSAKMDESQQSSVDNKLSRVHLQGEGVVVKVLQDDLQGDRHQKFIIRMPSAQTVLVAHNIDVAPRVAGLREGDNIEFFGEYEWNAKGGIIHWTHHDPEGAHADGWILHKGKVYK